MNKILSIEIHVVLCIIKRERQREILPEHAMKGLKIYVLGVLVVDLQDGVPDRDHRVDIS